MAPFLVAIGYTVLVILKIRSRMENFFLIYYLFIWFRD